MRPGMKLLAMEAMRRRNGRGNTGMGQEYYNRTGMDNEYAHEEMSYDGMENRIHNRQNRKRYDNGRFAPHNRQNNQIRDVAYDIRDAYEMENTMDTIGFNANMSYDTDEGRQQQDRSLREERSTRGTNSGSKSGMSKEKAMEWVKSMENNDGSKGARWTPEQTMQQMSKVGFRGSPDEFYAVMNSLHSDYSAVIKRYGVDQADFYAYLAKAWLEDKDAVDDKAAVYYEYVVKH